MSVTDANALLQVMFHGARRGDVALELAVRWERDGADAWRVTDDWRRMLLLLGFDPMHEILAEPPEPSPSLIHARCQQLRTCVRREIEGACAGGEEWWRKPIGCVPCADAIRAAVPPPTMSQIMSLGRNS